MAKKRADTVISPLEDGNQKYAIRSNADFVVLVGPVGSGKTFALYYAPVGYLALNDNAKIVCFMRNVSDFWGPGKVADSLKKIYPLIDRSVKKQPRDPVGEIIRKQEDMGMKFYNGSEIKFQQLDNEHPVVLDKIAKGLQAKKLIFDECNKFDWRTITTFMARLRSDNKGKAQIFLAQNPERECALRKICGKGAHGGGWINDDGTVDKNMDGVVMYFYMHEGDLEKMYWGKTKREVYEKAKEYIDTLLAIDTDMSYEDFILSMVFFTFDMRDNKKMLATNKSYRGMAANSATAASSYANNWNSSILDEEPHAEEFIHAEVSPTDIEHMFDEVQPPRDSIVEKRFMTMDMATTGFDNLIFMYWEKWSKVGFVCRDIKYSMHNTNTAAVVAAIQFREKHGLQESDMIIDVQGFGFLRECFPSARQFSGAESASNRGKQQFKLRKDEAGHVAAEMICAGLIHFEPRLAKMHYDHKNMKRQGGTNILRHLIFESRIFQFNRTPNGRLTMMSKDEMKKYLKGMSPDLTDNIILMCGSMIYDCHRMLSEDAGVTRKSMQTRDMLSLLGVNNDGAEMEDDRIVRRKITINNDWMLEALSTI